MSSRKGARFPSDVCRRWVGARASSCRVSCYKISVTRRSWACRCSHVVPICCHSCSCLPGEVALPLLLFLLLGLGLVCRSLLGWVCLGSSGSVLLAWCGALLGGRPFGLLVPSSSARPRAPLLGVRLGSLCPVCLRLGASGTLLSFCFLVAGGCWFPVRPACRGSLPGSLDLPRLSPVLSPGTCGAGGWVPFADSPAFWDARAWLVFGLLWWVEV